MCKIWAVGLLCFALSCADKQFTGGVETGKASEPKAASKDSSKKTVEESTKANPTDTVEDSNKDEVKPPPPVVPPKDMTLEGDVKTPSAPACKTKLDYNPSEILCAVNEADPKFVSAWRQTALWGGYVNSLRSKDAFWISPLKAENWIAGIDGAGKPNLTGVQCKFIPLAERLVAVSHFTLTEDTEVYVESVVDDEGAIRIWENADPKLQRFKSSSAATNKGTVALKKGFYSIVIDALDTEKPQQGWTGIIGSVLNNKTGAIIRRTDSTKDWCLFRLTLNENLEDFLPAAASCRHCFTQGKE